MPRLEYPRMDIAVEKLNIPWRRGDIGGVLVKCRKVLEEQKEITSRLLLAIPLYCETTIGLIKINYSNNTRCKSYCCPVGNMAIVTIAGWPYALPS